MMKDQLANGMPFSQSHSDASLLPHVSEQEPKEWRGGWGWTPEKSQGEVLFSRFSTAQVSPHCRSAQPSSPSHRQCPCGLTRPHSSAPVVPEHKQGPHPTACLLTYSPETAPDYFSHVFSSPVSFGSFLSLKFSSTVVLS